MNLNPTYFALLIVHLVLATGFTVYLLAKRRDPAVMIAWILGFFFVPFVALVVYSFFGYQRLRRGQRAKPHPKPDTRSHRATPTQVVPADVRSEIGNLSKLAEALTHFPPTLGNHVTTMIRPQNIFDTWIDGIQNAKHHVHAEVYIWADDAIGRRFRDALIAAARRGVECRILADSIGSWKLPKRYAAELREAGVELHFFSLYQSVLHLWHLHLRNHRKLCVIDGAYAFIGSANWLENYLEKSEAALDWHDAAIRVEGPAAAHLQSIFLEDWRIATGHDLDGEKYFQSSSHAGAQYVQVVPTGPDLKENSLHLIFSELLHSAQRRIFVISPYLVPSAMMALAIEGAARRGVEVCILVPAKPDNVLARWAGRSSYASLLDAQVRIFEHPEGVLHSKVVLIDETIALIGSANMDVRSFQLNFEAGAFIYGKTPVHGLLQKATHTMKQCREITLQDIRRTPWHEKIVEGLCRLLTPIL